MTIEAYLSELAGAARVRGAARRRLLRECRDHLEEAARDRGEAAAVRAFGSAAVVAAAYDAEVATGAAVRASLWTAGAVLATGISTLAVIAGSTADSSPTAPTTIVFFIAAQVAIVSSGLSLLRAFAVRRDPQADVADVMLLGRRNLCALVAAGLTLFAAAAALPGEGSPLAVLAGPVLAVAALNRVVRVWALARALPGARRRVLRDPVVDVARLAALPIPRPGALRLLALTASLAAAAAFLRDRAEAGTLAGATATAAVEVAAVLVCFAVLGGALGVRPVPLGAGGEGD